MIVTMKKLELLLHHSDREALLKSLQQLGLVHIEELGTKDVSLLQKQQQALKEVQQVLQALPVVDEQQLKALPPKSLTSEEYAKIVQDYLAQKQQLSAVENDLAQIKKDLEMVAPWGEYDPSAMAKLAQMGVSLGCYCQPEKYFAQNKFEDALVEEINNLGGFKYFVTTAQIDNLPHAERIILPSLTRAELVQKETELTKKHQEILDKMASFATSAPELCRYYGLLKDQLSFDEAKLDLLSCAEGRILELEGFFPADSEAKIKELLDKETVWYQISEPTEKDDVPIKFKNSRFNKLFLPITEIYQLPDYHEVETTPFIAPFFTLFFGVCLGDAGYGLLVLLIGLLGLWKGPKSLRPIMGLVNVLGLSTIACGLLLNGFFGQPIFGPGALFFPDFTVPLLSAYDEGWMTVGTVNGRTTYPAMSFALLVGFVQLCLGMFINMVNAWRQDGPVYALRPLSSLLMFVGFILWWAAIPDFMNMPDLNPAKFSLGQYNIGSLLTMVPDWLGMACTCSGVALLLLFGSPEKKFFIRPLVGLYDLYSFITGIMGDLLSYIRLFALGLGGGLVGASFNSLAMMIITDKGGDVNWATPLAIFTVLIIIVGHAINFALSVVSSFVHPLRLTFVEFYKNLGFKGGGRAYQPLTMNPLNKKSN